MKCPNCNATTKQAWDANSQLPVLLEAVGFAGMVWSDNKVRWGDTYKEHRCYHAATVSHTAFLERITTDKEREHANVAAEQRELAKKLAEQIDCPKARCEAKATEPCINLTIMNRTGERTPTAWPHADRIEAAMRQHAELFGAEREADVVEAQNNAGTSDTDIPDDYVGPA